MNTRWIILFIYSIGVTFFFIIYLFFDIDIDEARRTKAAKYMHSKRIKEKIHPNYYVDEHIIDWPFSISKHYNSSNIYEWHEPNKLRKTNPKGVGEMGTGFSPSENEKQLMDQLYKKHNYNLLASDKVSLHRSLPDARFDECKRLTYPHKLPTTSVIIIFHNEGWTTLLRTVWSIINRSPSALIKEIILVDDLSTWSFLKRPLEDYIKLLPVHVKLIRTQNREGLIRARLIGAEHAKGNVLTFLDAHMECTEGWLQPLLARIANDRSVIAVPVIDTIASTDMSYQYGREITINGFRWSLIYTWLPIPERELIRTNYDKTAPIRTPTMIGCGFSIDREFFFEIGSFDEGMNIWGSENMEMSLRVWQCGGSMNVVPCSRIGHLFRISTYSFDGDADEIKSKNSVRLVEVWMNDLKHLYYAANPQNKKILAGDLTKREDIKRRLKCKSFRWYLENVYPESNMRNDFIYLGEIKSASGNLCLDINVGDIGSRLIMSACHGQGGTQFFAFAENEMIVTSRERCVGTNKELYKVVSLTCIGRELQSWKYDKENKWLIHKSSGLCMIANQIEVILGECDLANDNCNWDINSKI